MAEGLFTFYTDEFSFGMEKKAEGEEFYVTGYISTSDLDRKGDIVSRACLEDMLAQLKTKNIKLDIEHESLTSQGKVPKGRIVDAELDAKGIRVRAVLNQHISEFKSLWSSINEKFIDAFSITYKALKFAYKSIDGQRVRVLDKVDLFNVALTGNPVNPNCRLTEVFAKSLEASIQEVDIMKDEKTTAEAKAEVKTEETKHSLETKAVEAKETVPTLEMKAIEELTARLKDFEAKSEANGKEIEALRTEIKSLQEAPILKARFEQKANKKEEIRTAAKPLDKVM